MEIQHEEANGKGAFFIEKDGGHIAEMTYRRRDDATIAVDHTGVDDSLQGQGVARKLLEEATRYAREHNQKIVPLCPYVKSSFEKNEEQYADVWSRG